MGLAKSAALLRADVAVRLLKKRLDREREPL
jgi:hypothetical protein